MIRHAEIYDFTNSAIFAISVDVVNADRHKRTFHLRVSEVAKRTAFVCLKQVNAAVAICLVVAVDHRRHKEGNPKEDTDQLKNRVAEGRHTKAKSDQRVVLCLLLLKGCWLLRGATLKCLWFPFSFLQQRLLVLFLLALFKLLLFLDRAESAAAVFEARLEDLQPAKCPVDRLVRERILDQHGISSECDLKHIKRW